MHYLSYFTMSYKIVRGGGMNSSLKKNKWITFIVGLSTHIKSIVIGNVVVEYVCYQSEGPHSSLLKQ